jgi:aspartate 1-decarboxylase
MARIGGRGDRIIVMAFAELEPDEIPGHKPRVVALGEGNRVVEVLDYVPLGASGSLS